MVCVCVCLQTLVNEGIKGIYKGISAPLATVAVFNAVLFASRGQMETLLKHADGEQRVVPKHPNLQAHDTRAGRTEGDALLPKQPPQPYRVLWLCAVLCRQPPDAVGPAGCSSWRQLCCEPRGHTHRAAEMQAAGAGLLSNSAAAPD